MILGHVDNQKMKAAELRRIVRSLPDRLTITDEFERTTRGAGRAARSSISTGGWTNMTPQASTVGSNLAKTPGTSTRTSNARRPFCGWRKGSARTRCACTRRAWPWLRSDQTPPDSVQRFAL